MLTFMDGPLVTIQLTTVALYSDSGMSFVQQVNSTVKSSFDEPRKLSMIRKSVTPEAAETLTHVFISSRLDFWNRLYYGLI